MFFVCSLSYIFLELIPKHVNQIIGMSSHAFCMFALV